MSRALGDLFASSEDRMTVDRLLCLLTHQPCGAIACTRLRGRMLELWVYRTTRVHRVQRNTLESELTTIFVMRVQERHFGIVRYNGIMASRLRALPLSIAAMGLVQVHTRNTISKFFKL